MCIQHSYYPVLYVQVSSSCSIFQLPYHLYYPVLNAKLSPSY
jgi:hypothetical protein